MTTSRRTFLSMLFASSAAGVLGACTSATPSIDVAPRPSSGDRLELVLGHFVPTAHEFHAQLLDPWARDVEHRSAGRLRITIHPGGALGPAPAQYRNVTAGAMDIGFGVQSYTPGRFPLTEGLELPFLWSSAEAGTRALLAVYDSVPALRMEYADTKVLALWANGPAQVLTTRKAISRLEDVRGLKLRSPGPVHNQVIEALGGVPVTLPASDVYDALERGVADGTVMAPSVLTSFNLADVVKYAVEARFTVSSFFLVMNKDRWEALPPDDQRILDETTGELSLTAARVSDRTDQSAREVGRTRGAHMVDLSADELGRWRAATADIPVRWASDLESRGLPGRQVLDELLRHSAEQG